MLFFDGDKAHVRSGDGLSDGCGEVVANGIKRAMIEIAVFINATSGGKS